MNADFQAIHLVGSVPHAKPYMNQISYSDVFPYEVVRVVSPTCVEVRQMDYQIDPSFAPRFVPGGFHGHVANNHDQQYTYSTRPDVPVEKVRLHKSGRWQDRDGRQFRFADYPHRFYDYNF